MRIGRPRSWARRRSFASTSCQVAVVDVGRRDRRAAPTRRSCTTSRPRRPRARRCGSVESSATFCSSSSTKTGMTSSPSRKPVATMSEMRPSMIAEVSTSFAPFSSGRQALAGRRLEARRVDAHEPQDRPRLARAHDREDVAEAAGTAAGAGSRRRRAARRMARPGAPRWRSRGGGPKPPTSELARRTVAMLRSLPCGVARAAALPRMTPTSQPAKAPPRTIATQTR